ncbi:DUF1654 domain-containing protein (plasmid) [Pseudomonas luteola]
MFALDIWGITSTLVSLAFRDDGHVQIFWTVPQEG